MRLQYRRAIFLARPTVMARQEAVAAHGPFTLCYSLGAFTGHVPWNPTLETYDPLRAGPFRVIGILVSAYGTGAGLLRVFAAFGAVPHPPAAVALGGDVRIPVPGRAGTTARAAPGRRFKMLRLTIGQRHPQYPTVQSQFIVGPVDEELRVLL